MIRARFEANLNDPRPVKFPPPHPWWCTGQSAYTSIVVAYADSVEQIKEYWPEAANVESEHAGKYLFTDRLPRPEWFGDES